MTDSTRRGEYYHALNELAQTAYRFTKHVKAPNTENHRVMFALYTSCPEAETEKAWVMPMPETAMIETHY